MWRSQPTSAWMFQLSPPSRGGWRARAGRDAERVGVSTLAILSRRMAHVNEIKRHIALIVSTLAILSRRMARWTSPWSSSSSCFNSRHPLEEDGAHPPCGEPIAVHVSTLAILSRRMAARSAGARRGLPRFNSRHPLEEDGANDFRDTMITVLFQLSPSSRGGWRVRAVRSHGRSHRVSTLAILLRRMARRRGWRCLPSPCFNSRHPLEEGWRRSRCARCSRCPRFNSRHPLEEDGAPPSPSSRRSLACFNSRHPLEEDGACSTRSPPTRKSRFQLSPSSRGGWRRRPGCVDSC